MTFTYYDSYHVGRRECFRCNTELFQKDYKVLQSKGMDLLCCEKCFDEIKDGKNENLHLFITIGSYKTPDCGRGKE